MGCHVPRNGQAVPPAQLRPDRTIQRVNPAASSEPSSALVAPSWAQPLANDLGIDHFDSWAEAMTAPRRSVIVVVDAVRSGCDIADRRDLLLQLTERHDNVAVIGFDARRPDILRPPTLPENPDDTAAVQAHQAMLARLSFHGPDLTRRELADLLGAPEPHHLFKKPRARPEPAFGLDYLREARPVQPRNPVVAHKRMYAALDPDGQLVVAGAFARGFIPVSSDWLCCHDGSPHDRIGPECYYGFSAYQHREDALRRKDPSAAVATVELSGHVMAAGGGVMGPELRGEHQRVLALEFPTLCRTRACIDAGRPRPATLFAGHPVLDDEAGDYDGYTELVQMCPPCADRRHHAPAITTSLSSGPWTIEELDVAVGTRQRIALSWLTSSTTP